MKRNKRVKRKRKVTPTAENITITGSSLGNMKLIRPRKEPPTELEVAAKTIGRLLRDIDQSRKRIGYLEQDTKNERTTLANLMLEHQTAVTKSKDLSLIPQPLS